MKTFMLYSATTFYMYRQRGDRMKVTKVAYNQPKRYKLIEVWHWPIAEARRHYATLKQNNLLATALGTDAVHRLLQATLETERLRVSHDRFAKKRAAELRARRKLIDANRVKREIERAEKPLPDIIMCHYEPASPAADISYFGPKDALQQALWEHDRWYSSMFSDEDADNIAELLEHY